MSASGGGRSRSGSLCTLLPPWSPHSTGQRWYWNTSRCFCGHPRPCSSPSHIFAGHAPHPGRTPDAGLVLLDLVVAGDAQIHLALAHKRRDVGGGEEDQRDGEVLDERDVETGFAAELDVRAGEEVECCLLEAALYFFYRMRLALVFDLSGMGEEN